MTTNYTPKGYCDKADIENFLLTDIDSSFDTQVDSWIAAAETWVDQYLGYTTASGVYMEEISNEVAESSYVDGDLNLVVFPRKVPVDSITSISLVKGTDSLDLVLTDGGENRYQLPEPKDRIVYPSAELSLSGSSVINNFADIKFTKFFCDLTYRAGYSTIPSPISMATVNVASDFIMRHANKEGLESISQGRITKRWYRRSGGESDFIVDAKSLLRPYRIMTNWL